MPSPVYRIMDSLDVRLSIRSSPSKFMNVIVWERCTSDSQIFVYGKVYYSNSIIITNFVQTLIPSCWFHMSSLLTLALKSPNEILIWYLRKLSNTCSSFFVKAALYNINFIFCWGMNIQNNDITSANS
jgi:hypothetical protein